MLLSFSKSYQMSKTGVTAVGTEATGPAEQGREIQADTKIGDNREGSAQGVGVYSPLAVTARQKIFGKKKTYKCPYLIFG